MKIRCLYFVLLIFTLLIKCTEKEDEIERIKDDVFTENISYQWIDFEAIPLVPLFPKPDTLATSKKIFNSDTIKAHTVILYHHDKPSVSTGGIIAHITPDTLISMDANLKDFYARFAYTYENWNFLFNLYRFHCNDYMLDSVESSLYIK
jgi:hypothetical protein